MGKLAKALGEVKFQEETNVELQEICDAAIKVKNAAVDAQENAAQVSNNAETHKADEMDRVEDEEDVFQRVEALLSTLGPAPYSTKRLLTRCIRDSTAWLSCNQQLASIGPVGCPWHQQRACLPLR